jgi:hypothetical protein
MTNSRGRSQAALGAENTAERNGARKRGRFQPISPPMAGFGKPPKTLQRLAVSACHLWGRRQNCRNGGDQAAARAADGGGGGADTQGIRGTGARAALRWCATFSATSRSVPCTSAVFWPWAGDGPAPCRSARPEMA